MNRIGELLERRGDAVHAYPETLPARPHPAGLNSGAEHEIFNAVSPREAIDQALEVVKLTESDPSLISRLLTTGGCADGSRHDSHTVIRYRR